MSMRILNVIGEMGYGGAELQTIEVAKRIRGPSVSVSVAVIGFCDDSVRRRIESDGTELILLRSPLRSVVNIVRLARLIRSGRFDVVHAHLFPSLYWVALAALLLPRNVRLAYTEHSTDNSRRKWSWLRWLERWVYSRYDQVICITDDVRHALQDWLPGLSVPIVIENGIDLKRFRVALPLSREAFGLCGDDRVIVMAGAFRAEKNHEVLVRSWLLLPDRYKLVLAGDGPRLPQIRSLVASLGLQDRVLLPGAVEQVERLLRMADGYVLPSLYEGFGLSAVEAAAAGLPVVYSDVKGLGSLFAGVGVAVDPNDADSIAGGIRQALESEVVRQDLCRKSLTLSGRYDIDLTARRYLQVYHDCLAD